jgi:hypothetical protein
MKNIKMHFEEPLPIIYFEISMDVYGANLFSFIFFSTIDSLVAKNLQNEIVSGIIKTVKD